MKKLLTVLALCGILSVGVNSSVYAQSDADSTNMEMMDPDSAMEAEPMADTMEEAEPETAPETTQVVEEEVVENKNFHQNIKDTFIDGGPFFMSFVLICFIFHSLLSC